MVDVGGKKETYRTARAAGTITMMRETFALVISGTAKKGDVLGVARIAAIQAAKRTSDFIPLAHPIPINRISVDFIPDPPASSIAVSVTVETFGRTGVEMEALTATTIGLLTIYDMCKAVDRAMTINKVRLIEKIGGKSGHYVRE